MKVLKTEYSGSLAGQPGDDTLYGFLKTGFPEFRAYALNFRVFDLIKTAYIGYNILFATTKVCDAFFDLFLYYYVLRPQETEGDRP